MTSTDTIAEIYEGDDADEWIVHPFHVDCAPDDAEAVPNQWDEATVCEGCGRLLDDDPSIEF